MTAPPLVSGLPCLNGKYKMVFDIIIMTVLGRLYLLISIQETWIYSRKFRKGFICLSWDNNNSMVYFILKIQIPGFPGGAGVKNPPANAGDMGSSPGPGRSHMPQRN